MIPISVCIIGKNEEKNIERCLSPLREQNFEIVYVDTGSTDRTKELAAEYTDNIYDFEWIGDFSAARNYAVKKASHNYVLIIDCDEFLTDIDREALEQAISDHPKGVGQILLNNRCESGGAQVTIPNRLERLFHRQHYRYENAIHEQICDVRTGSTYYTRYEAPITVDHIGYAGTAEERRKKTERNNELLFREIAKNPDDPYNYFQAAQSFNLIEDYENAYAYYKQAFSLGLDTENPWVYVMASNFINACVQLGRGDEALAFYLPVYDTYAANPSFLSSIGSLYLDLEPPRPLKAIVEFVKVLQSPVSPDGMDYSAVALYGMGYANELLGNAPAALDFYQKSAEKNYPLALQKLSELQRLSETRTIPVSVCIITKNEASRLQKCLEALKPYSFEIVVVDTGSEDNSIETAKRYTEHVHEFVWCDDFSAARNFAAGCASHDLLFPIDTDEILSSFDWNELQQALQTHPAGIGHVKRLDYYETKDGVQCYEVMIERIYDRRYYEYRGTVHEALVPVTDAPYASYDTSIVIDHAGYLGNAEQLREKAERNLALLEKALEADPTDPYIHFQIGQSYLLMRCHERACEYFKAAVALCPPPEADYTRMLINNYGNILIDLERPEESIKLLSYYEHYDNCMDYLCMIGLSYMFIGEPLRALPEFVKALTASVRDSIDPASPSYYVGYLYEFFGKTDIARTHYQNCGDYAPAVEALKRLDGA
mgnify:FL=1